ncbi:hypothetical protein RHSIM_Rhsim11G0095100 [Rhododendron simsii]|uniref:BZIP domain-containing protein n=1 Tax=Rhododendron simsii TaxID=118357 RepID=A0A834G588_RHOSS|nr:hypothetical protein RHSIM_Rhsim11G0095100 [Rhododendron simsii]
MSTLRQTSSSSITSADELRYTGMDERRRKRLISNRDSARRSRMRKQKTMEDLANAVTRLKCENNGLVGKIDKAVEGYTVIVADNNVLRAQAVELTASLSWLLSIMNNAALSTALGVRSVALVFSMLTIFFRLHFSGVLFLSLVFDSYDCSNIKHNSIASILILVLASRLVDSIANGTMDAW